MVAVRLANSTIMFPLGSKTTAVDVLSMSALAAPLTRTSFGAIRSSILISATFGTNVSLIVSPLGTRIGEAPCPSTVKLVGIVTAWSIDFGASTVA